MKSLGIELSAINLLKMNISIVRKKVILKQVFNKRSD